MLGSVRQSSRDAKQHTIPEYRSQASQPLSLISVTCLISVIYIDIPTQVSGSSHRLLAYYLRHGGQEAKGRALLGCGSPPPTLTIEYKLSTLDPEAPPESAALARAWQRVVAREQQDGEQVGLLPRLVHGARAVLAPIHVLSTGRVLAAAGVCVVLCVAVAAVGSGRARKSLSSGR